MLQRKKASLSFWKNDKSQGEAFENVIDNTQLTLPFFPSASISNNNDIISIVSYQLCTEETSKHEENEIPTKIIVDQTSGKEVNNNNNIEIEEYIN